jgi:hypothetical protein
MMTEKLVNRYDILIPEVSEVSDVFSGFTKFEYKSTQKVE